MTSPWADFATLFGRDGTPAEHAVALARAHGAVAPLPPWHAGSLRSAAAARGILFGAAANETLLGISLDTSVLPGGRAARPARDPKYASLLSSEFSQLTPENACKWATTEPAPEAWSLAACDAVRDAAAAAGQRFRFHNLIWGDWNPPYIAGLNASALEAALVRRVRTLVARYAHSAFAFDVVNEALGDAAETYKRNVWWVVEGPTEPMPAGRGDYTPDYIDLAFLEAAHARDAAVDAAGNAGSRALLVYNDYNVASRKGALAYKSDRMYELLRTRLGRGVPIDAAGLQLHVDIHFADAAGVRGNMQRLGALGLQVHVTEVDVSCERNGGNSVDGGKHGGCDLWSQAEAEQQAEVYAALLQACRGLCGTPPMHHTPPHGFLGPQLCVSPPVAALSALTLLTLDSTLT